MKILQIHMAMSGGGVEAMICNLANEMSKTEDVTVCSIFMPQKTDVFWGKLSGSVKKCTLGKVKKGFSLIEIFKIVILILRNKYDVVNMHGFFYYYALATFLLHRKVKFFYTVHSDAEKENLSWDKKFFKFKRFCFKKRWVVPITISEESQKSFVKKYNCESVLIYNGVPKPVLGIHNELKGFRLTPSTKIFIHAGRIDTPKNQIVLCRVFKRLIDEGFDVVLLIVGALQKEEIYNQIKQFFCSRIVYWGERTDVPVLMSECTGLCLPSIWEGLPITLLEALSVGCVPICSPVGGIPNVIRKGFNGLLSKTFKEEDYYQTMRSFLALDENAISQMRKNCVNSFSTFDIENIAQIYLTAYKKNYGKK